MTVKGLGEVVFETYYEQIGFTKEDSYYLLKKKKKIVILAFKLKYQTLVKL